MINQEHEGADQQARRTNVSTSTLENLQSTSVWQSWLAPLELVKDKQTAGAFNDLISSYLQKLRICFRWKTSKIRTARSPSGADKTTLASGRRRQRQV